MRENPTELRPSTEEDPIVSEERRKLFGSLGLLALGGGAALLGCEAPGAMMPDDSTQKGLTGATSTNWCDTMAEQQTITGGMSSSSLNICIRRGYASPGDGGGGVFVWTTDTTTPATFDPLGGVMVVPSGTRTGCWKRLFDGPVNILWFGAKGDYPTDESNAMAVLASTDNSTAVQAAITVAKGITRSVYIPFGHFRCDSPLDMTDSIGIRIAGNGFQSQLVARTCEAPLFDCTGSYEHLFTDFSVRGSGLLGHRPDMAFLLARSMGNGSAGLHTFRNVTTDGLFLKACVMSISSEANTYSRCRFDNAADGSWAVALLAQNDMEVIPPFGTFPAEFSGGNTVHQFTDGFISALGTGTATGGGLLMKDTRHVSIMGTFFTAGRGEAGIKIDGAGATGITTSGISGEVNGAAHGLVVSATATLANASLEGRLDGGIYGATGSTIQNSKLFGTWSALPPVDVDTIHSCLIHTEGLGFRARTRCRGNTFIGSSNTEPQYEFPVDSHGNTWSATRDLFGGPYQITHIGAEGNLSRLQTLQIKANVHQTRVQWFRAPLAAGPITPVVRNGATISIELNRNVDVAVPSDMISDGASNVHDEGSLLVFIFKQDATGGRTVTFDSTFYVNITGWSVASGPHAYDSISFILDASGFWVRVR
jgi:hypothetical protein